MSDPVIRLILPRESKSGNYFAYGHWSKRTKDRSAWQYLIMDWIAKSGKPTPKATGRRHVVFEAFRGRTLDCDNLSAGLKHCRDALVRVGLLVDDSPEWATFEYHQNPYRSNGLNKPCTFISILELK